jgi:hypothetical protein
MLDLPRYRPTPWNFLPLVLSVMGAAGLIALVWSVLNGGPWLFMLFWLGIVAWIAFNGIYRTSYELRFDDTYLYWKGFLDSGRIPVSDVATVDTEFTGSVAVIRCNSGKKIRVVILQGFAPFLEALTRAHPGIIAKPSALARFAERAQLKRKR